MELSQSLNPPVKKRRRHTPKTITAQAVFEAAKRQTATSKSVDWGTASRNKTDLQIVPEKDWLLKNDHGVQLWGSHAVPYIQRIWLETNQNFFTHEHLRKLIVSFNEGTSDIRLRPVEFFSTGYSLERPSLYMTKNATTGKKSLQLSRTNYVTQLCNNRKRMFAPVRRNSHWAIGFICDGKEHATTVAQMKWARWSDATANTEACRVVYPDVRKMLDEKSSQVKAEKRACVAKGKQWHRKPITAPPKNIGVQVYHIPGGFKEEWEDFRTDPSILMNLTHVPVAKKEDDDEEEEEEAEPSPKTPITCKPTLCEG